MRVIEPSVSWAWGGDVDGGRILRNIEYAGRTAYKSVQGEGMEGTEQFVRSLISRGHESVLEHQSLSVKLVCDRGVSHELVRHRLASYTQESTRYCNYSRGKFGSEIAVIRPCFWEPTEELDTPYGWWTVAMRAAEDVYMELLSKGARPEEARSVLPTSLATEVVMTANLREWRHFLHLRTAADAHPQMRQVAGMVLHLFQASIPVVFSDIEGGMR